MEEQKNKKPEEQNAMQGYNPANRDFQRTEKDLDEVSKSEKEELEKRKQRTHEATTKPDKDHIS